MLTSGQTDQLESQVYDLLWKFGMEFDHGEVRSALRAKGCVETPGGRMRFPRQLVQELIEHQRKTQAQDADDQTLFQWFGPGVAFTHFILYKRQKAEWKRKAGREFKMAVFGSGPNKFYDYRSGQSVPVTRELYIEMLKLVRVTPEFGYVAPWYRSDAHPRFEHLESLILGLKHAPEETAGIEPMYPEEIKYIKEIGEVMGVAADNVPYLSGSISVNRPLNLDSRNLEQLLERRRQNIRRYRVSSMPTFGLGTPATMAGAIALTAAELLAGMTAVYCVEPEPELTGRVIANTIDMRNAAVTSCAPEGTLLNLGVKELFDGRFGGHLWCEPFFAVSARRPGLQAVFENFFGASRYARLTGLPQLYPGLGNVGYMGTGSPTQAMLDLHIRKATAAVNTAIEVSEETLAFQEIVDQLYSGQDIFLDRAHTARHAPEIWNSPLFLNEQSVAGAWEGDEKCLLDRCDQMWRENVRRYQPPELGEKEKALDAILARARREFAG
jgi:trimethylamine:corrinoid methyltransferase-like protein